ncbi:MAG: OsmC family protein [Rhodospirillaceae bacterium]
MAKVIISKSEVEGYYTGSAGEFRIDIERAGNNVPRSIDLLLLGLGTCTISTVAHYMERKGLTRNNLSVELSASFDEKEGHYGNFSVVLRVDDAIPEPTRKILAGIAKTCRIHRTLDARPHVALEVAPATAAV